LLLVLLLLPLPCRNDLYTSSLLLRRLLSFAAEAEVDAGTEAGALPWLDADEEEVVEEEGDAAAVEEDSHPASL